MFFFLPFRRPVKSSLFPYTTLFRSGFTDADPGALPEVLARARRELAAEGGGEPLVVHFLAVPPAAYPVITRGLGRHGLAAGARVVFEKPYGRSLADFEALDVLVKRSEERRVGKGSRCRRGGE